MQTTDPCREEFEAWFLTLENAKHWHLEPSLHWNLEPSLDGRKYRFSAEVRWEAWQAAWAAARAAARPKPRRTGGQKARDSIEHHAGHSGHDINDLAFAAFAKEWGIPDDPEPPSDGLLLQYAIEAFDNENRRLSDVAAEFLRLRAERDGGAA